MIYYFPGKFQPPHIGHVMTICKLMNDNHIIIGISEGPPRVMKREEVKKIFEIIFGSKVNYHFIDGVLTDHKNLESLPNFDVLVSGNDEVLQWGLKLGLTVKKVSRSECIGASGTEIRSIKCKK